MAVIVIFDPNSTPNKIVSVLPSVHQPDFNLRTDVLVNPDLSSVSGIPQKYWKHVTGTVIPMTTPERESTDAKEASLIYSDKEAGFLVNSITTADLVEAIVRAGNQYWASASQITKQQFIDLVKFVGLSPAVKAESVSGAAGTQVVFPFTFRASKDDVASLQFDLILRQGVTFISAVIGIAGKTLSSVTNAQGVRILIVGLNQVAIGPGELCRVTLAIAGAVPPGAYPIDIFRLIASSPAGSSVALTGLSGVLTLV